MARRSAAWIAGPAFFVATGVNFVVYDYLLGHARRHGVVRPTGSWTSEFRFQGGVTVYLPQLLRDYLVVGFWAHWVLLGLACLFLWVGSREDRPLQAARKP